MKNKNDQDSHVREVEVQDLDELLGTKAATVIAPDEESKKSVLQNTTVDTSFLDNPDETGDDDADDQDDQDDSTDDAAGTGGDQLSDILDQDINPDDDEDEIDDEDDDGAANKGGRKPALIEAMSKLQKKGIIQPFEDAPDLANYTTDDIVELIETNIATQVNEVAQQAPMQIFSQLDPKVQEVVAYNLNGGADITNVLKNVARSQEISNLDVKNEEHQERIAREWLKETNFGTDEEIEEEISAYIDRGELEKKANQFKPKLDKKQAEIMQKKLADQEERRKQAEEAKKSYAEKIFHTLNNPQLNGLPLNNNVQTALYYGITDTNTYQDREGNPTNELGYLIEQYQIGKDANPAVLLEALWLLKDPQGYRQTVQSLGKNDAAGDAFRKLKTAEGNKITSSSKQGEEGAAPKKRSAVKRRNGGRNNIFQRNPGA